MDIDFLCIFIMGEVFLHFWRSVQALWIEIFFGRLTVELI